MRVALALTLLMTAACGSDPAPYVLVHGAWMGAWAWDDVAKDLRGRGHAVTVVELPAHGQDQTPVAGATLDAYTQAALSAIDAAPTPVVLVGHSMGGVVISSAAEARPARVQRLVYVAAYLPKDGQSLLNLAMTDAGSKAGPAIKQNADGTLGLPQASLGDIFCADCGAAALARLTSLYRDEPAAPFVTAVKLSAAAFGTVPRSYVFTAQDNAVSPALQQAMVAATPVSKSATVTTSHSPMLSQPAALVTAILGTVP